MLIVMSWSAGEGGGGGGGVAMLLPETRIEDEPSGEMGEVVGP